MRLRDAETLEFVRAVGPENAGRMFVSENCLCLRRSLFRNQLAIIPPSFGVPRLRRLKPRIDLHQRQKSAIEFIQEHPNESFLLSGKNGTGKSHLGWALYRNTIAQRRPAVVCTVRDLLAEFRRVEIGVRDGETLKSPRVTAETLRRSKKQYLLFLDEFEKARPTEFASEQLFNLLDAANSFAHQLVITSNMKPNELRAHWGRVDEVWGTSIMKRLEVCHQIEFF